MYISNTDIIAIVIKTHEHTLLHVLIFRSPYTPYVILMFIYKDEFSHLYNVLFFNALNYERLES